MPRIHLLLPLLLAACSSPAVSQSHFPHNPAVSDAQGHPRDSSTFYFPKVAMLPRHVPRTGSPEADEQADQAKDCRFTLSNASTNLIFFGAPVLSNYYLGHDMYRFLWLRSFERPVLITLTRQGSGATLRTQWLSKWAGLPKVRLSSIDFTSSNQSPAERERLRAADRASRADPEVLRNLAEMNRRAERVPQLETTRPITPLQWQQFERLLQQCRFQQQVTCGLHTVTDGAYWILEAHTAGGYHAVFRHSPDKQDGFRQACEYLIGLSSARKEERY
ncbi:hypothetical protein [Hymenobacter swuensis]|uniref:Lipoprotein n=1 Tax=Hymenobacter swuensis DY53 TaxID=1227739 RepID=W8EXC5_9BACT|nr:hypothetical protein [Hymenobacter swuensis]AHJ97749.1 hypothetical protein Hsw_2154 [Hymenobacter swuensis DY53]